MRQTGRIDGAPAKRLHMETIKTERLDLVASTASTLEAELESNRKLAGLLDAEVPDGWPPGEYDTHAIRFFLDLLQKNPDAAGWFGWYALLRVGINGRRVLVGAGGYFGPPGAEGVIEIGYSIVPAFERRGLATEMVGALVRNGFAHPGVKRIIAHTTPANAGSLKVLEKTGFVYAGPGRDDGTVQYERLLSTA
jgi:[ribosomal protein S5]-alanine N-acetyltransferase